MPTARTLASLAAAAVLTSLAGTAGAATYCVDDSAILPGTGSCWTRPFHTIQEAIDHSVNGDIIQIATGVYAEELWLDYHTGTRDFRGAGAGLTIMRAPSTGSNAITVWWPGALSVSDISFEDYSTAIWNTDNLPMTVRNCSFTGGNSGIRLISGDHRIEGNLFEDLFVTAVSITPSTSNRSVTIVDNDFLDVGWGVTANDTPVDDVGELTRVNIYDNRFDGTRLTAIELADPNGKATVYGNLVTDGYRGLDISGGGGILVFNNIFDGNSSHAIQTTLGSSFIVHNTMRGNGGAGIRCYTAVWNDTSTIGNNAMLNNRYGLSWDAGCHATARNNAAYGNTSGNIVGLTAAYDLGGNLDGVAFSLTASWRPIAPSPVVGAAYRYGSAYLQVDYWGTSRGTSPEIGACEAIQFRPPM